MYRQSRRWKLWNILAAMRHAYLSFITATLCIACLHALCISFLYTYILHTQRPLFCVCVFVLNRLSKGLDLHYSSEEWRWKVSVLLQLLYKLLIEYLYENVVSAQLTLEQVCLYVYNISQGIPKLNVKPKRGVSIGCNL